MNPQFKKTAILGLRWVLSLVVLLESVQFMVSPGVAHLFAEMGLPPWIRPALGGIEAVAALLFLIPAASVVGGYALLAVFAIAAGIHFLHGQYEVGSLAVYTMAVIVCMTDREAPHER
jgi:hypothetical protein